MSTARHIKLFRNGRNQALRIPRDMELPGEDALIRQEGAKLIVEPAPTRSLLQALAGLPPLDAKPEPIEELPIGPVTL